MRQRSLLCLAVATLAATASAPPLAAQRAPRTVRVRVTGRTFIAFTDVTPDTPMDSAEAAGNAMYDFLADYAAGLAGAVPTLQLHGIRVIERTADTLVVLQGRPRPQRAAAA